MSYKLATYISLLFIVGLGILFFVLSFSFTSTLSKYVGPATFPQILSFLIVVFSVVSFITTKKQKHDQKIELPNFRIIARTVGVILLFILAWEFIGLFYIFSTIFVFSLLYYYNNAKHSRKKFCSHF